MLVPITAGSGIGAGPETSEVEAGNPPKIKEYNQFLFTIYPVKKREREIKGMRTNIASKLPLTSSDIYVFRKMHDMLYDHAFSRDHGRAKPNAVNPLFHAWRTNLRIFASNPR